MALALLAPERLTTRVMFAMEFVDPITGWIVRDGLKVTAEGFGPPIRPPSGCYVWLDVDPPAQRQVRVTATAADGRFADFAETITVPQHVQAIPAASLLFRRVLAGTSRLLPPPGLLAVEGQIKRGNPALPLAGVKVLIELRHGSDDQGQNGATFSARYAGGSDAGGGFVAAVTDLSTQKLDRGADGRLVAWLRFTDSNNSVRYSAVRPLQPARLNWLTPAFQWEALQNSAPF